jgi:prephenate dehydrogenase
MKAIPSQSYSVGIIGGKGQLGAWCLDLLEPYGHRVLIADVDTALSARDVVAQSDIVIVSVPIGKTAEVLAAVSPLLRPEQLVIDFTSAKTPFVSLMEASHAEVLSVHPMFAPQRSITAGQTCVVCRVRQGRLGEWFESFLTEVGLRLVAMTAEQHDRTMAFVQGLTHFQALTAAHCMAAMDFEASESMATASPVYRVRLAIIGRVLAQNPRLYAEIQIFNPYVKEVLEQVRRSNELFTRLVDQKDVEGFIAEFVRVREALGSFSEQSLEESARLISV